jgi:hypothetical protein
MHPFSLSSHILSQQTSIMRFQFCFIHIVRMAWVDGELLVDYNDMHILPPLSWTESPWPEVNYYAETVMDKGE